MLNSGEFLVVNSITDCGVIRIVLHGVIFIGSHKGHLLFYFNRGAIVGALGVLALMFYTHLSLQNMTFGCHDFI